MEKLIEAIQNIRNMQYRMILYDMIGWPDESFDDGFYQCRYLAYKHHNWPDRAFKDSDITIRVAAYTYHNWPIAALSDSSLYIRSLAAKVHSDIVGLDGDHWLHESNSMDCNKYRDNEVVVKFQQEVNGIYNGGDCDAVRLYLNLCCDDYYSN